MSQLNSRGDLQCHRRTRRTTGVSQAALHGFTLVELLVVIGIIAVLVSILLPTLSKARQWGKQIACLSNVRQLMGAATMYANDNHGYLPRFDGYYDTIGTGHQSSDYHWTTQLFPYVGQSAAVYECPATEYIDAPQGGILTYQSKTYTARLGYKVMSTYVGTYGTVSKASPITYPFGPVFDQYNGTSYVEAVGVGTHTMKISNVAQDTVMIFDGFNQQKGSGAGDQSAEHFGGRNINGDPPAFCATSIGLASHEGERASIAFADNHAEVVYKGTLLTEKVNGHTSYPAGSPSINTSPGFPGRVGDFGMQWNNGNGPKGRFSAEADD